MTNADNVKTTGTHAMLLEQDGLSRVEERAIRLAKSAGRRGFWREYLDEAKAQLVKEFEADTVDIADLLKTMNAQPHQADDTQEALEKVKLHHPLASAQHHKRVMVGKKWRTARVPLPQPSLADNAGTETDHST